MLYYEVIIDFLILFPSSTPSLAFTFDWSLAPYLNGSPSQWWKHPSPVWRDIDLHSLPWPAIGSWLLASNSPYRPCHWRLPALNSASMFPLRFQGLSGGENLLFQSCDQRGSPGWWTGRFVEPPRDTSGANMRSSVGYGAPRNAPRSVPERREPRNAVIMPCPAPNRKMP